MKYMMMFLVTLSITGAFVLAGSQDRSVSLHEYLEELSAAGSNPDFTEKQSRRPKMGTVSGKRPCVVTEQREFDFGIMAVNTERDHEFLIRNTGEGSLRLAKGKTTCKCTIAEFPEVEILPGEAAPVRLTWRPRKRDDQFRQTAVIHTNDSANPSLEFVVQGRVEPRFVVEPGWMWHAGDVQGEQRVKLTGRIYSAVEERLEVLDLRSYPSRSKTMVSPLMRAERELLDMSVLPRRIADDRCSSNSTTAFSPLSGEELDRLGAKSGYTLTVEFRPGSSAGLFREDIEIRTNLLGDEILNCCIVGNQSGLFALQPPPSLQWSPASKTLDLGKFESKQGLTVEIPMRINVETETPLEVIEAQGTIGFLRCSLLPDPRFKSANQGRYRLAFEIPGGYPRLTHNRTNPVKVRLRTNHPRLPELEFNLIFSSL